MENKEVVTLDKNVSKPEKTAKRVMWIVILAVVVSLTVMGIFALAPSYVANADEFTITEDEFHFFLSGVKSQMLSYAVGVDSDEFFQTEYSGEKLIDVAKEQALAQVVEYKIQLVKADEEGVVIPQDELESYFLEMDDYFTAYAEQYGITVDELAQENYDLDYEDLKAIYKNVLLVEDFATEQIENIVVTEEEAIAYYEENEVQINNCAVRHILFLADQAVEGEEDTVEAAEARAEALANAEEILAKAQNGEDFDAMIVEYSEDTGKSDNYGIYYFSEDGYSSTGATLVDEFVAWAFENEEGDMGIVQTEHGYHVMVLDTKNDTYESNADGIDIIVRQSKYYEGIVADWALEDRYTVTTGKLYDEIE